MRSRFVKIARHLVDVKDPQPEPQEALFALEDDSVLKLDNNEATDLPSPVVLKALGQSLVKKSLNYEPDLSCRRLRRKLSRYCGADFDSISCFSGMAVALDCVVRTYLQPGLEALALAPLDDVLARQLACAGAELRQVVPRDIFEPGIEEIVNGVTAKTRLIFIANPNGISGASLSAPEIVFILSYAEDSLVVVDESYFEFHRDTVANLVRTYPNLAVLRTNARGLGLAGLETAYVMSHPENIRFINRTGFGKGPCSLAQVALLAALSDMTCVAHHIDQVNESKRIFFEGLSRLTYKFRIASGNFLLVWVKDAHEAAAALAQANIYVKKLANISGLENCLRITIGGKAEAEMILKSLASLAGTQAGTMEKPIAAVHKRVDTGVQVEPALKLVEVE